jgi:hypothetical protein
MLRAGGDWICHVAHGCELGEDHRPNLRRIQYAAYGLRWLEIVHGLRLDLRRSLVRQLPVGLLDQAADATPRQGELASGRLL